MSDLLQLIKDTYWAHRDIARVALTAGSFALIQLVLVVWTMRHLRELGLMRERLSRLADGLALLTDTTEAGLATLASAIEARDQSDRRRQTVRPPAPRKTTRRVMTAVRKGDDIGRIIERESLSESEVRLHMKMAAAGDRD
jgi:hypothetical protein